MSQHSRQMLLSGLIGPVCLSLMGCGRSGFQPAFEDDGAPIGSPIDADPSTPDADPARGDAATLDCWDAEWSERERLVFDNSAQTESLEDFVVLVTLNNANIDYSKAQGAGQDLRFVDRDGTILSHEIESWNTSGDSIVWLKVPRIDGASNTDFVYMLYGNSSAPDGQAAASTWSDNYQGVWHLSETSGPHVDSASAISCAWLGGGGGSQNANGRFAGANDFDGLEDSADCGTNQIADLTGNTVTAWVNMPLTGDTHQEVVSMESLGSPYRGIGLYIQRSNGAIGTWHDNGYTYASTNAGQINAGEWTYVAIRSVKAASGGLVEVSKNAGAWESIASGDTSDLQIEANTPLILGKWPGPGPDASTRGRVDEIQISGVARSDEWIRAQYLSMSNGLVSFEAAPQDCP